MSKNKIKVGEYLLFSYKYNKFIGYKKYELISYLVTQVWILLSETLAFNSKVTQLWTLFAKSHSTSIFNSKIIQLWILYIESHWIYLIIF